MNNSNTAQLAGLQVVTLLMPVNYIQFCSQIINLILMSEFACKSNTFCRVLYRVAVNLFLKVCKLLKYIHALYEQYFKTIGLISLYFNYKSI